MTLSAIQLDLSDLFNVIVDAVIAFDQHQRILYFNQGAEAIFGYAPHDVLGQPLDMLLPGRFIEAHRQHFQDFLESPVASRPMGQRRPIYGRARDGREFPAEAAITKLQREHDTLSIVVMRDITERKLVEDEFRAQAEQLAVAAERSRLARDLHDAVTQTLFSASLIADVLPRIWERNPAEGKKRLEELRQLSRGALAEMRTLLLELRPAALMEANLAELLKQLAASIASRARVSVDVRVEGQADLPPDVKVSLYRIAQEALNNVAKHSGATEARVMLTMATADADADDAGIQLTVTDNGSGFDTAVSKPTHIGLDIMRERAAVINADLNVTSHPGKGTTVQVILPATHTDE